MGILNVLQRHLVPFINNEYISSLNIKLVEVFLLLLLVVPDCRSVAPYCVVCLCCVVDLCCCAIVPCCVVHCCCLLLCCQERMHDKKVEKGCTTKKIQKNALGTIIGRGGWGKG